MNIKAPSACLSARLVGHPVRLLLPLRVLEFDTCQVPRRDLAFLMS